MTTQTNLAEEIVRAAEMHGDIHFEDVNRNGRLHGEGQHVAVQCVYFLGRPYYVLHHHPHNGKDWCLTVGTAEEMANLLVSQQLTDD